MEYFERERLWLCRLVNVERSRGIMVLQDRRRTELMIITENDTKVNEHFISLNNPTYFNLEGNQAYHGTQKTVYNQSDIGKTFVMYRHNIPDEYLTEREIKTNQVSYNRVLELSCQLADFQWKE